MLTTRPRCLLILGDSITSKWNQTLRWNPLGNWVILIFNGQKPSTRKNFTHIASFFTLYKGYSCNKLYEITLKKRFLWEPEKKNHFKSFKFHNMDFMHDDFTCIFSILWNLKFIFSGSHKKLLSLVLLQITNYTYSPGKVWKRIRYRLKYSGTRFLPTENKIILFLHCTRFPDGFLLNLLLLDQVMADYYFVTLMFKFVDEIM